MIRNLGDAFDYVNQRYVFNEENYPVLKKLNENETTVFALKHSLLHMQKNITIINFAQRIWDGKIRDAFDSATGNDQMRIGVAKKFRTGLLKMLVNYIKLGETLGFSKEEMERIPFNKEYQTETLYGTISTLMESLAKKCEKADHGNLSEKDIEWLKERFVNSWGIIMCKFEEENFSIPSETLSEVVKFD